jgi:iron complex outermembrane receptor protein
MSCGLLCIGVVTLGFGASLAQADMAAEGPIAPPSTINTDDSLGEIIVTAERKPEPLQKVPMSIEAFSASDVSNEHIVDTQDLQIRTPGLVFGQGNGFAQPYIRGVGTAYAGTGLETSVATYVDDVYVQQQTGGISQLLDLKQAEVLKGPQGTLYGRNATGGAVVVQTQDPTNELEVRVKASYGNLGEIKGEGMINAPLTDTLSVRVAGLVDDRTQGYIYNVATGNDLAFYDRTVGRVKLAWRPAEGTEVIASVERYTSRDSSDEAHRQGDLAVCSACNLFGLTIPAGFYQVSLNTEPAVRYSYSLANLHASTDLGPVKLFSVTSYRESLFSGQFDQDITAVNLLNYIDPGIKGETFEQELRAQSQFNGPLNVTGGMFYEHDHSNAPAYLTGTAFGGLSPGSQQDLAVLNALAVFGEVYYDLTEQFRFTVGGRYNHDNREFSLTNNADGVAVFGVQSFTESKSFSDFTPRAVVAYNAGDLNLYASYSTGFKSGGYNVLVFTEPAPVNSEKLRGEEVGGKFALFDRKVKINTSFFRYKYQDMQVTFYDPVTSATILKNAADSTIWGADLDVSWTLLPAVTLNGGLGYLHARFDSFPNGSVYAQGAGSYVLTPADLSGTTLPYSPTISAYLSAAYSAPITAEYEAGAAAIASYSTRYDFLPEAGGPLGLDHQDALTRVNLTGEIGRTDKRWTVGFYIDNLTNKKYFNERVAVGMGDQELVAPPRTYGGSLECRF